MAKTVNLNALLRDLGGVELDGATYSVRPLKGRHYQALQAMQRDGAVDVGDLYRIAGECLTGLADECVQDLTIEQINAVISAASGGIAEVAEQSPKAETTAPQETPSA